jgi:hypothetical protein
MLFCLYESPCAHGCRWSPSPVTQRGNRREAVFFEDGDQQIYCDMLAEQLRKFTVEVWAYCLMPNHPFDFDAAGSRGHEPGLGRSALSVYQLHQCA